MSKSVVRSDPYKIRRISVLNATKTEDVDVHFPHSCSTANKSVLLLLEDANRDIASRWDLLASDLLSKRPIANAICAP